MKQKTLEYRIKNIIQLISLPLIVFVVMNVLDLSIAGTRTVSTITDLKTLLRTHMLLLRPGLKLQSSVRPHGFISGSTDVYGVRIRR